MGVWGSVPIHSFGLALVLTLDKLALVLRRFWRLRVMLLKWWSSNGY